DPRHVRICQRRRTDRNDDGRHPNAHELLSGIVRNNRRAHHVLLPAERPDDGHHRAGPDGQKRRSLSCPQIELFNAPPTIMKRLSTALLTGLLAALFIAGCDRPEPESAADEVPALKDVFDGAFLIGAAINPNHYFERDEQGAALVKRHFNTVTAENSMKWERIHPEPGRYDFENADQFVQFAEENGMFIVGHTLVWHSQIPSWVFEDAEGNPVSRDTLLARMRDHIQTVVGRYKGRVHGWDVVNEALNEDGTLRRTPFLEIIGEDYIRLAFQWAHEVDPDAELYYNDYSLENEQKRDGAVRLVKSLLDQGIPVTAI